MLFFMPEGGRYRILYSSRDSTRSPPIDTKINEASHLFARERVCGNILRFPRTSHSESA